MRLFMRDHSHHRFMRIIPFRQLDTGGVAGGAAAAFSNNQQISSQYRAVRQCRTHACIATFLRFNGDRHVQFNQRMDFCGFI